MIYLLGANIRGENVIFIGKDKLFIGSESLFETSSLFEKLDDYKMTGSEWSSGKRPWWMQYEPLIFEFEDLKGVEQALLNRLVVSYSNVIGVLKATKLRSDYKPKIVKQ